MGAKAAEFFDRLAERGAHLVPSKYVGSVRFDLGEGQRTHHWMLEFSCGDVRVMRENREADCVMRSGAELFDRIVSGEENITAALLRGAYVVEGDLRLLTGFRKLLPGPPDATDPRSLAPGGRRTR
jgi:hypothetical protein